MPETFYILANVDCDKVAIAGPIYDRIEAKILHQLLNDKVTRTELVQVVSI